MQTSKIQSNTTFKMQYGSELAQSRFKNLLSDDLQALVQRKLDKIADEFRGKISPKVDVFISETAYDEHLLVNLKIGDMNIGRHEIIDAERATHKSVSESIKDFNRKLNPLRKLCDLKNGEISLRNNISNRKIAS